MAKAFLVFLPALMQQSPDQFLICELRLKRNSYRAKAHKAITAPAEHAIPIFLR